MAFCRWKGFLLNSMSFILRDSGLAQPLADLIQKATIHTLLWQPVGYVKASAGIQKATIHTLGVLGLVTGDFGIDFNPVHKCSGSFDCGVK